VEYDVAPSEQGNARASSENAVRVAVRTVWKRYDMEGGEPVRALSDVSLEIRIGEMVALIGPSGCGKSTMLNLMGCVDLPTSGTVAIDGAITSHLGDAALTRLRRDRVGTVFQFFNLLPALTVAENVALPLVLQRCAQPEVDRRVAAALEGVDIADKAGALPRQLSGGQAQRAAVARAVIHRPAIILADEPTGNLDSVNGDAILQLLASLARGGETILLATHSPSAAAYCDRVIAMQDGRIVAS
jgi:putative ABC transport system ATP-binding protein